VHDGLVVDSGRQISQPAGDVFGVGALLGGGENDGAGGSEALDFFGYTVERALAENDSRGGLVGYELEWAVGH
jgi:hypothetical protein